MNIPYRTARSKAFTRFNRPDIAASSMRRSDVSRAAARADACRIRIKEAVGPFWSGGFFAFTSIRAHGQGATAALQGAASVGKAENPRKRSLFSRALTYPMSADARRRGREGGRRMELSLCMIARDEEGCLGACLESVRGAVDEIVVLDTGSRDATKAVARRFTDRVYDYEWNDDFSAARNASLALAKKPYILWLDADDVLDPPAAERLHALKPRLDGKVDAVFLPYLYAFGEDGAPSLVFERERIVRRDAGFRFAGVVHEAMPVSGSILHEDIPVRHTRRHGHGRRNLDIYEAWLSRGRRMSARDRYYYARELRDAGETERAAAAFSDFLGMEDAWIENALDAHVQLGACLERLGRTREARQAYLGALARCAPRAEALCALGGSFEAEGDLEAAEYWYRAALQCRMPLASGAFVSPDAYGYEPLMRLCVVLDRMGRTDEAREMNARALRLRPGDANALSNEAYFAQKAGERKG